jgi:hypothetical protein
MGGHLKKLKLDRPCLQDRLRRIRLSARNRMEQDRCKYIIRREANSDTIYDQDVICYDGRDHFLKKWKVSELK